MQLVRTLFKLKAISIQFEHQSVLKKNSIKNTFHVGNLILVTLTPKSNSKNNLLHTGPKCATCEKTFQTKELFPSNICFDEVFLVQACQSMSLQPYFMSGLRL